MTLISSFGIIYLEGVDIMQDKHSRIIKEQDELELEINKFQNMYLKVKSDYNDSFSRIPQEAYTIIEELSNSKGNFEDEITNLFVQDNEKFKEISKKLKSFPEYEEMNKIQILLDELEYKNSIIMISYIHKIEDDRKKLFSDEQLKKLDTLAENGWFLYYLRSPDLEMFIPIEDFDDFMVTNYSRDNYRQLKYFTEKICDPGLDRNKIRLDKISDLKEVISSLEHGNLRSAARTMFSLLEHEHRSCSNLKGISTGIQRSKSITKQVESIGLDLLKQTWRNIDNYFKKVYSSGDEISNISRHELAHGIYNREVVESDVIKLIFLYVSFKELSYYLRLLFDTSNMLIRDLKMQSARINLEKSK